MLRETQSDEAYIHELEDFTHTVCHELTDPLRKIKSYGELALEHSQELNGELKSYILHMISCTQKMEMLISSLLEFTQTSKKEVAGGKVDLNIVIENVLEELDLQIRASKANIVIIESIQPIEGDAFQMHRLFTNILSNALKFCNKDPQIIIHAEPYQHYTRLMIQDNGVGIPDKYLNLVFTPFCQIDSQKKHLGAGIGLSICKKIVEKHKGQILVESHEKLGTIVIVDLPAYQPTEEELLS